MNTMPAVRPLHVLIGIGAAAAIWLTRSIIPLELWGVLGIIAFGGLGLRWLAAQQTRVPGIPTSGTGMQDNLDAIQSFLEEKDGHYQFDIWEYDDTVNEDTLEKNLAGTKQEFYAVIGARYKPNDEFPRLQLFVWNETKNKKHAYYRDVQNENLKHDPLYRHYKRRFLKSEGRADPDTDSGQWVGTNINVEQSNPDTRRGE